MQRLSAADWIDAAFDALCDAGVSGLRVEPLADRLGVTKGSFYWHFRNRQALFDAVLTVWEAIGTAQIIDEVEERAATPAARLRALGHRVFAVDPRGDAIESAIRAWASTDETAAAVVARVDERRLAFVRDLLIEAGVAPALAARRAGLVYRALIGEFVWRSTGGRPAEPDDIDDLVGLVLRP